MWVHSDSFYCLKKTTSCQGGIDEDIDKKLRGDKVKQGGGLVVGGKYLNGRERRKVN